MICISASASRTPNDFEVEIRKSAVAMTIVCQSGWNELHLQESFPLAGVAKAGCLCYVWHVLPCKVFCRMSSTELLEVRRGSAGTMMPPLRAWTLTAAFDFSAHSHDCTLNVGCMSYPWAAAPCQIWNAAAHRCRALGELLGGP